MGDELLTDEERRAIASLERLAKRWPPSLLLFSWSGTLCVMPADWDRTSPNESVITYIEGIPNDGGDP